MHNTVYSRQSDWNGCLAGNRIDQDGSDYLLKHNSSYMDLDNDPTEQAFFPLHHMNLSAKTCLKVP